MLPTKEYLFGSYLAPNMTRELALHDTAPPKAAVIAEVVGGSNAGKLGIAFSDIGKPVIWVISIGGQSSDCPILR
jgi:hypothetical protein